MSAEDDYDDLDDYLEGNGEGEALANKAETPLKEHEGTGSSKAKDKKHGEAAASQQKDEAEIMEMVNGLQAQLEGVVLDQEGGENTVAGFKKLVEMLGQAGNEAGAAKPGATRSSDSHATTSTGNSGSSDFKDIVSNTLDRLKENSTKIDTKVEQEQNNRNSDDILSQLLSQLTDKADGADDFEGEGVDNAILNILNQMSSKEVMYQPMKEMQIEFIKWMEAYGADEEHKDKIEVYKQQLDVVNTIVTIYERDDYSNESCRDEITDLIDRLEQLGDSPVSKGFNSTESNRELNDFAKMLEVDNDGNLGHLDKELQDTCKNQ